MEVKLKRSQSIGIKVRTPRQYGTLSQHLSCSDLTELGLRTKEREKAQPVKIAQLLGLKSTNASVQKRLPERIPRIYTEAKKIPSASKDNVYRRTMTREEIQYNSCLKNIQLKYNEDNTFKKSSEHNIRRNLNLNFKTPKQKMEKKHDTTCVNIQKEKKSICPNLNGSKLPKIKLNDTRITSNTIQQRKSFLLPPNSIKSMYCEQQLVKGKQKVKQSSNMLAEKENRMQRLTNIKENIDLKESRKSKQMIQAKQALKNVDTSSYHDTNLNVSRLTTCKSHDNAVSTTNDNEKLLFDVSTTCNNFSRNKTSKYNNSLAVELSPFLERPKSERLNSPSYIIRKSKNMHTCLNKDSYIKSCINDLNLEHLDQKLKNALLTTESNLMGNNYCCFSSENDEKPCIKRDTLLLLESNLKNLVNMLHENSNKIELILNFIGEILNTDMAKTTEQVTNYKRIYKEKDTSKIEIFKNANIEFLQSQEDKENSEDLNLSSCSQNSSKKLQPAKFISKTLTDTNQINITFESLENRLGITYTPSSKLTPVCKIKNCDNYDEPFLKEYMNLKSSFNILETPQVKKNASSRKSKKVPSNIQADKHYISNRILRSIQDLYDADSSNS